MITLFLDTTLGKHSLVIISDGNKEIAKAEGEEPLPTIELALKKAHLTLKRIDNFSANSGPGSYTGIRVGLAVINALNWSLGKNLPPLEAKYQ